MFPLHTFSRAEVVPFTASSPLGLRARPAAEPINDTVRTHDVITGECCRRHIFRVQLSPKRTSGELFLLLWIAKDVWVCQLRIWGEYLGVFVSLILVRGKLICQHERWKLKLWRQSKLVLYQWIAGAQVIALYQYTYYSTLLLLFTCPFPLVRRKGGRKER